MSQKSKTILFPLLAIFGYYVFFQAFYDMIAYHEILPFQDMGELLLSVALNFPPVLLTFLLCICVVRTKRPLTKQKLLLDLVLCLVGLVAINYLYLFIVRQIFWSGFGHIDWAGTVFNLVIIFLSVEVYFYHVNYMRQIRATEEQRRMAIEYRYEALRSQFSPHFLFNSLNILYALIGDGRPKAQQFVEKLAKIYQYVLFHQEQDTIALEDEMKFVRTFVEILKIRYDDGFQLLVEGEEKVGSQRIIPFTLQLLVENVVKHNVVSSRNPMTAVLSIAADGLTVTNPIRKRISEPASTQVGLSYLQKLYHNHGCELYYGRVGETFRVHVPFIKPESK